MPEVLLSSDSLTVLGGPASVKVGLDVGPAGKRGSAIFLSNGNPNIPGNLTQTPSLLDLAINVNNLDETYRYVYQYLNVDGSNTWVQIIDLAPGIFAARINVLFNSGSATLQIPVSKIVPDGVGGAINVDDLVLSISPNWSSSNVVSINASITGISLDGLGQQVIDIELHGEEWMGPTTMFQPLNTAVYISINIQLKTYDPDLTYIP